MNNLLDYIDYNGQNPVIAVLLVVGTALFLTGCEQEEYESIVQPIPSPTPTTIPIPQPTPSSTPQSTDTLPKADSSMDYIKVDDYKVAERKEFIEFMKYAESGGNYNGSLHDANRDSIPETIAYGHDVIENKDMNIYTGKTLSEEEGEKLLIQDLEERVPKEWLTDIENSGHQFTAYEIDALVSLIYAVGIDWANETNSPTLTSMIKTGNYTKQQMYDEFL